MTNTRFQPGLNNEHIPTEELEQQAEQLREQIEVLNGAPMLVQYQTGNALAARLAALEREIGKRGPQVTIMDFGVLSDATFAAARNGRYKW